MMNKALLIGRLGENPELRYTPSGAAVAKFSLATSEKWADKSGEKKERTEWHKVIVWGKLAELVGQYLSKGKMAHVEGRITTRQWDDKDGQRRYTTEIVASHVLFLSPTGGQTPADREPSPAPETAYTEEDIPF